MTSGQQGVALAMHRSRKKPESLEADGLFLAIFNTRFDYEPRAIGENREAARYAGIDFLKNTIYVIKMSRNFYKIRLNEQA